MCPQVSCRVVTNNNIRVARGTSRSRRWWRRCTQQQRRDGSPSESLWIYLYKRERARAYTCVTWAADVVARTPGPRGSRRNAADRPARNPLSSSSSSCTGHVFVRQHQTHCAHTHTYTTLYTEPRTTTCIFSPYDAKTRLVIIIIIIIIITRLIRRSSVRVHGLGWLFERRLKRGSRDRRWKIFKIAHADVFLRFI